MVGGDFLVPQIGSERSGEVFEVDPSVFQDNARMLVRNRAGGKDYVVVGIRPRNSSCFDPKLSVFSAA